MAEVHDSDVCRQGRQSSWFFDVPDRLSDVRDDAPCNPRASCFAPSTSSVRFSRTRRSGQHMSMPLRQRAYDYRSGTWGRILLKHNDSKRLRWRSADAKAVTPAVAIRGLSALPISSTRSRVAKHSPCASCSMCLSLKPQPVGTHTPHMSPRDTRRKKQACTDGGGDAKHLDIGVPVRDNDVRAGRCVNAFANGSASCLR